MKAYWVKPLSIIALFSAGIPARAQDANQIVRDCIAATQKLSSYKCSVTDTSSFFGLSSFEVVQQRAEVKDIQFGNSFYAMSGFTSRTPAEKKPINLVYNGNDVRILDHTDNSVYLFTDPSPKQLGVFTSRLEYPFPFVLPFWNSKTGEDPLKSFFEISHIGTKDIFSVECDIIRCSRKIKRPDTGEEIISSANYLIAKKDHIARGIELDKQRIWVKMEEYDQQYAFENFVVSVPKGFDEKKVSSYTPPDTKGLLTTGTLAPQFVPETMKTRVPQLTNKVVLIDFWGTWCGPCRLAMPHLQSLYQKYKAKGLEVIGISVADAEGAPEKYMKDNLFTYHLFTKGEAIAKSYQVNVFPTVYLIGKDGKIIYGEKGIRESFEEDVSKLIEKALEK